MMKNTPTEMPAEPKTEERLPWHRPQVQVLTVSLDTKLDSQALDGSGTDFAGT